MNNKFKRALSSILAFIMLCSCMCVMNVSSVFAADTVSWSMTDYTKWTNNGSALTSATISAKGTLIKSAVTLNDVTYTLSYNGGKSDKFNDKGQATDAGFKMNGSGSTSWDNGLSDRAFLLTVPASATVTVSAEANGENPARLSYSWGSDGSVTITGENSNKSTPTDYSVTNTQTTDKDLYFTFTAKQVITGITLSLPSGNEKSFTLTGDSSGLDVGTKFNVGDHEVTVGDDGVWNFVDSAETSPFSTDTEYNVTPPTGYSVSPTSTTFEVSEDGLTYTAKDELVFTSTFATIQGTVDEALASVGDTVVFIGDSKYTAKLDENRTYTIEVPAGTYTITLEGSTYRALQKYIAEDSITVKENEEATKDLTAGETITTWDFKNDAAKYQTDSANYYKVESGSAIIKGLYINAEDTTNNAKFNPRPDSNDAQVNNKTIIYVPVSSENDTVTITNKGDYTSFSGQGEYTTRDNGLTYRKFESASNGYITSITVTAGTSDNTADITTVDSESNVAHVLYNGVHYAVVAIAGVTGIKNLVLSSSDMPEPVDTDTVYESVTFDKEYTASDFNSNITSGYVFAFKIDGSNTDDAIKSAVAAIKVTVEKVTE